MTHQAISDTLYSIYSFFPYFSKYTKMKLLTKKVLRLSEHRIEIARQYIILNELFLALFLCPPAPLQRPGSSGWEDGRVQWLRSEELPLPLQRSDPTGPQHQLSWPHSVFPDPHSGAGGHPRYS